MVHSLNQINIKGLYILGSNEVPVYLYQVNECQWILIEGGVRCWYEKVWQDLCNLVTDLSHITHWFITHSHYDHCGLLPLMVPKLPNVTIIASSGSAKAWQKSKSIRVIEELNQALLSKTNTEISTELTPYNELSVQPVSDQESIQINATDSMKVISTPGHSRDQVAYLLQPANLLFVADALGELTAEGDWNPLIFDNAVDYLTSIHRLCKLTPAWVFTGHYYSVEGGSAAHKALKDTEKFIAEVLKKVNQGQETKAIAAEYSKRWQHLSEPFLPDNLHLQSMHRMLNCVLADSAVET